MSEFLDYIKVCEQHVAEMYPLISYKRPRIADLPPGAIIGNWAYSVPGQIRFILAPDLEIAPGVLPGDLARAWIKDRYKLPLRRRKEQTTARAHRVPLHARLGQWGDCAYVDIKAAYLHILRLGYDLEYEYSSYLGASPQPVPPEVEKNKLSYAITVAMSYNQRSTIDIRAKVGNITHRPINIYSNPCLWNLAQDTLCAIGSEIIATLGDLCVYANTDGYIIRQPYAEKAIEIIESWGFKAAIKHEGDTIIRGVASYKIGDKQSRRHIVQPQDFTSELITDRDERRWLKTRWVRWAHRL